MDRDRNGKIELEEWVQFWTQVRLAGHEDEEIRDELENIRRGKSWIGFNDVNPSRTKN